MLVSASFSLSTCSFSLATSGGRYLTNAKAVGAREHEQDGDRDARGSISSVTVGRTSPRSSAKPQGQALEDRDRCKIRRSGLGRRENVRSPGQVARSQSLRETPTRRKSRSGCRERARCGCTQFVRVAEVGWTHRASSALGGRKTSWSKRALARKKLEAPPDAEHERTEGESVRGGMRLLTETRRYRIAGLVPALSGHDRRRSWASARSALTGRANPSPWLAGQTPWHIVGLARVSPLPRSGVMGSASGGRNRLGRACKRQRSVRCRRGLVKALRGPRRSKGSSHPRR